MVSTEEQEVGPVQFEEEFSLWKKNASFLYDIVVSQSLEWSSLTSHWVPISTPMMCSDDPSSFAIHQLVLSTYTSDDFPNFFMLTNIVLPIGATKYGVDGKSKISMIPKVDITQKIRVDGEVNKAQCMSQNPTIIGAKTSDCEVYVFDTFKTGREKARRL